MKRIAWIDSAKGLGIILVVLAHDLPRPGGIADAIYTFHIPLFFFLSGLTAKAWTPGSLLPFAEGFKKLIIPYIFFSIVSISMFLLVHHLASQPTSWTRQLGNMLYGVSGSENRLVYNLPLWFLTCLISIRILFAVLTSRIRSNLALFSTAICLAAVAHAYVFPNFSSFVWNFDIAFVGLVFFTAGYALRGKNLSIGALPTSLRYVTLVGIAIVFAWDLGANSTVDMNGRQFGFPALYYLGAFAGIALSTWIAELCSGFSLLETIGHASIVIFPVHSLFWLLPYKIFSYANWYIYSITHSNLVVASIICPLQIFLCLPFYFLLDKWAPGLIGRTRPRSADVRAAHINVNVLSSNERATFSSAEARRYHRR